MLSFASMMAVKASENSWNRAQLILDPTLVNKEITDSGNQMSCFHKEKFSDLDLKQK